MEDHRSRLTSRPWRIAGAGLAMLLLLGGCGRDDRDTPLQPSNATPVVQKQRTLTRAEYPAMREWIISDASSAAELRPVCAGLDAAPSTPVIRASRNACDRALSIAASSDGLLADAQSECRQDFGCLARLFRGRYRRLIVASRSLS